MFVRRSKIEALYESRIEDLKAGHERELVQVIRLADVLAEQIDYLRGQLGRPHLGRIKPLNPADQPELRDGWTPWMTEEEEDIEHLRSVGQLSDTEADALAEQIRDQLGLDNLTIE